MNILYKFKGRLRFETEADAEKHCRELLTNVFSIFWRLDPDYGLRRVYTQWKKLCFNAEIYGTKFAFSDTLKMIKAIANAAKSGRVRIYEESEFQEIIPSAVRLEKQKLADYSAYLESLGKDVLDSRKSSYEQFLKLKRQNKFNDEQQIISKV